MRIKLGYDGEFVVGDYGPLDELDSSIDGQVVVTVNLPYHLAERIFDNRVLDVHDVAERVYPYLSEEDQDRIEREFWEG